MDKSDHSVTESSVSRKRLRSNAIQIDGIVSLVSKVLIFMLKIRRTLKEQECRCEGVYQCIDVISGSFAYLKQQYGFFLSRWLSASMGCK